jgi:hypothetical protein
MEAAQWGEQANLSEARFLHGTLSDASHMHAAFPKSYFDRIGLVSLLGIQRRFSWVS